jgi:hypothetical protein
MQLTSFPPNAQFADRRGVTKLHSGDKNPGNHSFVNQSFVCLFSVWQHYQTVAKQSVPLMVPATIYFLQNFMIFFVLKFLTASTFNALNQLKLLTSAVFAVFIITSFTFA